MFSLESVATSVREGAAAILRVHMAAASQQPQAVVVTTTAETAQLGTDYMQFATRITFAPGETVREFKVQTLEDVQPTIEGPETFLVTVSPQGASLSPLTARVTINDVIPQAISTTSINVTEGNSGTTTATFTVSLAAKPSRPISVHYATRDGSASVADGDYVTASGTLFFATGEVTKIVSVAVNGDVKIEPGEHFFLDLSNATGGYVITTPTATCTIVNDDSASVPTPIPTPSAGGFQIDLTYDADVPQSVKTAARAAADRWQQIITGDLPNVTDGSTVIDDITINVAMGLLSGSSDGKYGTAAQAGVVRLRGGDRGLPWKSHCGIDPPDANNPQLLSVLVHEFGHALGFPLVRAFKSYISNTSFTGPNALREYKMFFPSALSIPMDSAKGHWSESALGNEIMTPMLSSTNRLSRITVGAMQDAGYTVDYSKADPFIPILNAIVSPGNTALVGNSMLASRQPAATVTPRPSASASSSLMALASVVMDVLQRPATRGHPNRVATPRGATGADITHATTALETAFGRLASGT